MPANAWETMRLPVEPTATAPDGSDVRVLLATGRGSLAHFELAAGRTSIAVEHRTVEEIWFFLSGSGEMWRSGAAGDETVEVTAGVCLTLPVGTRFQFRAGDDEPLRVLAATMPPWPGEGEAIVVEGPWAPTAP
jgi:mannose-6-phosphate isomerase-like protein (cupin superfamily)